MRNKVEKGEEEKLELRDKTKIRKDEDENREICEIEKEKDRKSKGKRENGKRHTYIKKCKNLTYIKGKEREKEKGGERKMEKNKGTERKRNKIKIEKIQQQTYIK